VDETEIDVDALAERRAAGPVALIDVRQPDEYEELHVAGAVLIPLAEVPDRLDEIPVDGPVYMICRSGARSGNAADFLRAQGREAINVAGGMNAWVSAGEDIITGAEPG
jgi:rhodanese-related sulfurtransferase